MDETEMHDVMLDGYTDIEWEEEPAPEGCFSRHSSPELSSQSEYEPSPPKMSRFSILEGIDDSILENIYYSSIAN